jgi:ABC-type tungstate transport system permease subunit
MPAPTIGAEATYNEAAERIAVVDGYASDHTFAFRDHFCIVGPKNNPAGLVEGEDALSAFQRLYTQAEAGTTPPTRFLSRFDKSATNIKESSLWAQIGQVPWGIPYSTWYHIFLDFPIGALEAAAALGQYTLTDWGTWLSAKVPDTMVIYRKSSNDLDDVLLNPCHALASTRTDAPSQAIAKDFIAWMASPAGQTVITSFELKGQVLYTGAPPPSPT